MEKSVNDICRADEISSLPIELGGYSIMEFSDDSSNNQEERVFVDE